MMKYLHHAILATLVMSASSAFAQVQLMVDDNIKVTAINGQEIQHNPLQPLKREFSLEAGRHVITARYDRLFDLTRGDHDYLKSGNITLTADLDDNQTYQLVMPDQPNTYNAAKEYVKAPSLAVLNQDKVIAQSSAAQPRGGILSSLTSSVGNIFKRDDGALYENQKAIAALNQQQSAPVYVPQAQKAPVADKSNLDTFMQLWLNSSEAEREKIRQWVQK